MNRRSTIQRTVVLETVKALSSHATADEIYDSIIEEYPNISRGTVYRNLCVLSEGGEVRKVIIPGGADRYDHQCHNHYHVQCSQCGGVFDVDMDFMDNINERIKDLHGFIYTSHDIVFKGICPECNNK